MTGVNGDGDGEEEEEGGDKGVRGHVSDSLGDLGDMS